MPHREPALDLFHADVDNPGSPAARKAAGSPGLDLYFGKTFADALQEGLYAWEPSFRGVSEKAQGDVIVCRREPFDRGRELPPDGFGCLGNPVAKLFGYFRRDKEA